jgi:hypothetical protein
MESAGPNAFSQIARPVTIQGIADELASQRSLWVELTHGDIVADAEQLIEFDTPSLQPVCDVGGRLT